MKIRDQVIQVSCVRGEKIGKHVKTLDLKPDVRIMFKFDQFTLEAQSFQK